VTDGDERIPFNATGISDRDRITRLEVLREADRERLTEMQKTVERMDVKLDALLDKSKSSSGALSLLGAVFGSAGPLLWAAVIAVLWWAFNQYLAGRHA
jgi:hypothetical protein